MLLQQGGYQGLQQQQGSQGQCLGVCLVLLLLGLLLLLQPHQGEQCMVLLLLLHLLLLLLPPQLQPAGCIRMAWGVGRVEGVVGKGWEKGGAVQHLTFLMIYMMRKIRHLLGLIPEGA
jgi:hypothetical protein